MNIRLINIILVCLLMLNSCRYVQEKAQEKIVSDFKKLSDSMQHTDCERTYTCIYSKIDSGRTTNQVAALHADTLYNAANGAIVFMDSLSHAMLGADAGMESTAVPKRTLFTNNNLAKVGKKYVAAQAACYSCVTDSACRKDLDSVFAGFQLPMSSQDKLNETFSDVPTSVACSLLNVMKKKCEAGATIGMECIRRGGK